MEDFVELGIEGIDKVVDKHFHKLPDSALHGSTYHPRQVKKLNPRRRSRHKRRSSTSSLSSEAAGGNDDVAPQGPRSGDTYTYTKGSQGSGTPYSALPSRIRPEYQPPLENPYDRSYYSASPVNTGYNPQARRGDRADSPRTLDDDYYSESPYARPRMVSRRSNSLGAPKRPQDSFILSGQRLKDRRRRKSYGYDSDSDGGSRGGNGGRGGGGSGGGGGGGSRKGSGRGNPGRGNGLEDKIGEVFTDSNIGLGASVLGAVVGGWATSKAQIAGGVDKVESSKRRNQSNTLMTVLGAAAAGLAANALVDRWEENKKKNKTEDDTWNEKHGKSENGKERQKNPGRGIDIDRDRDRRKEIADYRREFDRRGHRSRRDDGYLAEGHGRGYEPLSDEYD
ncbi:hypothetical protein BP6252_06291 [Coleophoma cylindrospora]|uniref:Glycine zipper 2TM domain-containing protein n=1 Tax=Coleophoma cylindrospora TaxID=1849047 RepID=A0A3D8RM75_9HELO|nr:hypothetical protein BP6252_06291 [Coleophoma cylindrospora]